MIAASDLPTASDTNLATQSTCSAVVGVLYPAYQSFKAIEAPLIQHEERDKQWLTYWSIHGSLSLAERLFHNQVDG